MDLGLRHQTGSMPLISMRICSERSRRREKKRSELFESSRDGCY